MLHLFFSCLLKDLKLNVELLGKREIKSKVVVAPETKHSVSAN